MSLAFFLAAASSEQASLLSASKLLVPLFAMLTSYHHFSQLTTEQFLSLSKRILMTLVYSQLLLVVVFYSGLFSFLFHLVEPGNVNRELAGFRINVYQVPFLGVYRFGSVFVEPSWFSFFTGFFLLLWFVLLKRSSDNSVSLLEHGVIGFAFIMTLSFTGLFFLLVSYLYRLLDTRYPIRFIVFVPVLVALVCWILMTNEYLAHRILLIASGDDASVNARIFASWDKAFFILNETNFIGAGPGRTIELINHYFQINLSIQNAYLEAFAAMGIAGGAFFILTMHYSLFVYQRWVLQLPLILALSVSSIVFTPVYWLLAFYLFHVARAAISDAARANS
ncbi:hypothetical protein ORJ04_03135 [Rheinheimera baltica]|uniref:Uncharacterized protein n=1 Tax=Rheinheimera baltica TaxID=67576 RepID=A0ABT9HUY8_9GAMM|nr:hypothetical protein [Rheinheimera baltica]MDP5134939.1 hypothetical protein [Rheinheimera baltica]MDP5149810.1 hypothetical protein [Rheinheimera baltica]